LPSEFHQRKSFRVVSSAVRVFQFTLVLSLLSSYTGSAEHHFLQSGAPLTRGADAGFLLDTPTRIKIDLSGSWTYSIDGGAQVNVLIPASYDFRGSVLFERKIVLTQDQLDVYTFHLVMLGVNYAAEVSINGEFVANHVGGFTSVVEPLAPTVLQAGRENVIRIAVSNELDAVSTLPLRPAVWGIRNYGGITRDIYLLGTPRLYIRDVTARAEPADNGQSARITVRASAEGIDSASAGATAPGVKPSFTGFAFEVVDKISGTTVGKSGVVPMVRRGNEWGEMRAEIAIQNPRLWSPESPELYLLRCYLVRTAAKETRVLDEYDLETGVRNLAVAGGHLQLNGRRLIVKGVTWYEDHPALGSALTDEVREKDVVMIKNLGANLIRFVGHPPHPTMLDLCDRYGLLAMVELPLVQTPGHVFAAEGYQDLAQTMLREMIVRDRNHPSVLAWGLGDEIEASHPAARDFIGSLARLARSLDNRLLYIGEVPGIDACTDLVDLAAVNMRAHDPKTFRAVLEARRSSRPQQPVIAAKIGTEVQQENRRGYSDPLSQEAQARFYLQRFEILKSLDCDGGIVWSFNDWKGDRPALTVHSGAPLVHTVGLVNAERERRLAYDAVRSIFHGEKFLALAIGSHSASAPIIFVLVGFVVLIGMAYVYNANRRFRESLNRSLLNSYNFFADIRDQRIVSLGHSTLLGFVVAVAVAIVLSSILYRFRDSLVLDNLLTYLLVSDVMKDAAVTLIWNPILFIGAGAVFFFLLLLCTGGGVHVLNALVRARISAFHAYTIVMWSSAPLLILVPVGMILYRVMDSSVYVAPAFILVAVLLLWVYARLLKGVAIVADVSPLKAYAAGVLAAVAVAGGLYAYYDYAESMPMYVSFLSSTIVHLQ